MMERLIAWTRLWTRPGHDFSQQSEPRTEAIRKGNFGGEINKRRTLHP